MPAPTPNTSLFVRFFCRAVVAVILPPAGPAPLINGRELAAPRPKRLSRSAVSPAVSWPLVSTSRPREIGQDGSYYIAAERRIAERWLGEECAPAEERSGPAPGSPVRLRQEGSYFMAGRGVAERGIAERWEEWPGKSVRPLKWRLR